MIVGIYPQAMGSSDEDRERLRWPVPAVAYHVGTGPQELVAACSPPLGRVGQARTNAGIGPGPGWRFIHGGRWQGRATRLTHGSSSIGSALHTMMAVLR